MSERIGKFKDMKTILILLIAFCSGVLVSYIYLSRINIDSRDAIIYQDSVKVLLSEVEALRTHENELNEFIEGSKLTVQFKDQELNDVREEFERIKNAPPRVVVITDTVDYIDNCEKSKELLTNSLKQISILDSKCLIYVDIVNDQSKLIANLRTQNKKLSEVIDHKNSIISLPVDL